MPRREIQIAPDLLTILAYFLLVITGWLILYSVNSQVTTDTILTNYVKQIFWIIASIILGVVIIFVIKPYTIYSLSFLFFGVMILITVAVAVVAVPIKGARSWIHIGPFSVQPAEFLKFATALVFARLVAKFKDNPQSLKALVISFAPVFLAFVAVVAQGDMGTALVFSAFVMPAYREGMIKPLVVVYLLLFAVLFFVSLVVSQISWIFFAIFVIATIFLISQFSDLWKSISVIYFSTLGTLHFINVVFGLKFSHLITISVSFIVATVIFVVLYFNKIKSFTNLLLISGLTIVLFGFTYVSPILYNKLEPHQRDRIEYFIHPEKLKYSYHTRDVSYNIRQAILSISAGGLKGRGYLKGTHNKLKFVPEQDKDYIFCTVAEELGFIGSVTMFGLFFFLFLQIFKLAERHKSVFVRVYGYSLLGLLFMHFAINLGSTLSLLPVIGIPLPFYSYGGSAMLNFSLMVATLINFDRYRIISFEEIY